MNVDEILRKMVEKEASDVHLRVPSPPVFRVDGALIVQEDFPKLGMAEMESVFEYVTTPEQREEFYKERELDFAYSVSGLARFRVNAMQQRGTISMAFRVVPFKILTIDELSLPQICKQLIHKPRGMILVTGPTGSGKSTTLAAMIDYLNETRACNVITIEDPIEYLHRNKKSLIAQRDLGDDTRSFNAALVHSLRHDPDVIVIGEMRDIDTMSIAIRAAETGHLVLGTLHTRDATQTIDRIIDMFPPSQQSQIRLQVSQSIEGILSQALLPRKSEKGRVAAFEIMLANPAVRNLIRDGRTYELPNVIQLNNKDGMITLDQSLADLVVQGLASREEAISKSSNPERLDKLLQFKAQAGYGSRDI
ncbi:MAG: type IV pilus twitching motility protein PilT [Dehalococcoidales bacterium]|nr:type IV pilus twitching motility protein PilT [Dehalococcoidales bacterium]